MTLMILYLLLMEKWCNEHFGTLLWIHVTLSQDPRRGGSKQPSHRDDTTFAADNTVQEALDRNTYGGLYSTVFSATIQSPLLPHLSSSLHRCQCVCIVYPTRCWTACIDSGMEGEGGVGCGVVRVQGQGRVIVGFPHYKIGFSSS